MSDMNVRGLPSRRRGGRYRKFTPVRFAPPPTSPTSSFADDRRCRNHPMAPPPRHTGAEERTDRRHQAHGYRHRHHDSGRRRSPGSDRASPIQNVDTRSQQAPRNRDPPSHPHHRRAYPSLGRDESPELKVKGRAEQIEASSRGRDHRSPPPRSTHHRTAPSPPPRGRYKRRERSQSFERHTHYGPSERGGKGAYRTDDRDFSAPRRRRSPRRSPSPEYRARARCRSRSPKPRSNFQPSSRRSRTPVDTRRGREPRRVGEPDWGTQSRRSVHSRDRAKGVHVSSRDQQLTRQGRYRRSPSRPTAPSQRRREPTPTPRTRRRSVSSHRDSAAERRLPAHHPSPHQSSRSSKRTSQPSRKRSEERARRDQPNKRGRSRSRSRDSNRSARKLSSYKARRRRSPEDDEMYHHPPRGGGYYGQPPPYGRGFSHGPPPIDTRFGQSPPLPMAPSPHHPPHYGHHRGGHGGSGFTTPNAFSSHQTPPQFSPYDNRGYGLHQGSPPPQFYSPHGSYTYSNHSSPGPNGLPPRGFYNGSNQYPSHSPHGPSPTQGPPPQFANHPSPAYSQRGGRGGGPRGGYAPRAGYGPNQTAQSPHQSNSSPQQARGGPHFANLTWKPGVGTRGGSKPDSLFQAAQGQTAGPNGPVTDKSSTKGAAHNSTKEPDEGRVSSVARQEDEYPKDSGVTVANGSVVTAAKSVARETTIKTPPQASSGANDTFPTSSSPSKDGSKISFKLNTPKPGLSLPPRPGLFIQTKNAQSQEQVPARSQDSYGNMRDNNNNRAARYDNRQPNYSPRDHYSRERRDHYRGEYRAPPRDSHPGSRYRMTNIPPPSAPPPLPTAVQTKMRSEWELAPPVFPVDVTANAPVYVIRQAMDGKLNNFRPRLHRPQDIPQEWKALFPPRATLPDIYKQARNQYPKKDDSVVGAGTYGQVYKSINVYKPEQGHVALKRVAMASESSNGFPFTSVRELSTLVDINDPKMPKYFESMLERVEWPDEPVSTASGAPASKSGANKRKYRDDLWYYMVFEYAPFDLAGILNHPVLKTKLDLGHRKDLATQMYEGLNWLHSVGILHRDVKAGNILVDHTGMLKLTDFGLAKRFDPTEGPRGRHTNRVVTIWYRCPELLLGDSEYGTEPDLWAAACVLFEILLDRGEEQGRALFPCQSNTDIMQLDFMWQILGKPTAEDWPDMVSKPWYNFLLLDRHYCKELRQAGGPEVRYRRQFEDKYGDLLTSAAMELLQWALQWDPKRRPDGNSVLRHKFFTKEQPAPRRFVDIRGVIGSDYHEHDFKKQRDKERQEKKEKERRREHEAAKAAKRGADEAMLNGEQSREGKKQKRESTDNNDDVMAEASMEPGAPKEPGTGTGMPGSRVGSGGAMNLDEDFKPSA